MAILRLEGIEKSYQDGDRLFTVLKDVHLSVEKGEFVAILGPSGSGKSTFLSIAGILLSPDKGKIFLDGRDLTGLKQGEWTKIRREQIGFIFQNHQLLPYMTIKDQLSMVACLKAFSDKKKAEAEILSLLEELGIGECQDKYPSQMSGGQRQRAAIARSFISKPQLILADEPTASLDERRGRQIVELIREQVKEQQTAALMVTHDQRVLDLVDKIYRLEDGHLVEA